VLIIVIAGLASTLVTGLVRHYLVTRNVLDIPNGRSSHSIPTPRGGGASIVLVFLLAILWLVREGALDSNIGWALTGGGLAIALAGFLDDHFHLSARMRLLIHFTAAGWALWRMGGMGPLHLGWAVWDWGWIGQVLAVVGLVWMINLYNFMDGIDGLAGLEALCVSGLGSILLASSGLAGLAETSLVLAAASAGFLVWNWPPAKIFMGDAGSGFLGFVFGVLAISSAREQPSLLWPWLILLAVFIVDSMLTLVRRLTGGSPWYQAHCSHAYQHAARQHGSHLKVTLAIAVINVIWLFPLGWAAYAWPVAGPLLTLLAMVPLAWLAFRYHAGQEKKEEEKEEEKAGKAQSRLRAVSHQV
jgi:Fuc2NAc and GlcNAc transferase